MASSRISTKTTATSGQAAGGRDWEAHGQVITTTSMYDVLARRHRGDGSNGVYIQPYCAGETRDQSENYAVANRFCFFDEDSTLWVRRHT